MRSTKYPLALIPPIVLCLTSCSVFRNQSRQTQTREEIRSLSEKVGNLEQSFQSVETEIRQLNLDASRRTDCLEAADVETVTETFDTDKPTDPATGTPPLKSRETQRRAARSATTVCESARIAAAEKAETRDSSRTVMDSLLSETSESLTESSEDIREEAQKKGLSWWQKILMYTGAAAILLAVILAVFKYGKFRLNGIQTALKKLLNSIVK